jgi:hypothetical protein
MSLPTVLGIFWNLVTGNPHAATLNSTMREFRTAGTVLTLILLALAWFRSLRRDRWQLLALSLFVVVVLGPSVQPWYFCWGLAIAAVIAETPRRLCWLAAGSVALVVMIRPNGTGLQMQPVVIPIIAGALVLAWWVMLRRPARSESVPA